jgi:hypothetical protein
MVYEQLYVDGITQSPVFSLLLKPLNKSSIVEFGDYNPSYLRNSSEIVFIPLAEYSTAWKIKIDGFRVGT